VPHEALAQRQPAPFHLNHLIDAPPGRIHFQAKFAISGAGIKAKAATNAPGVVHPTGSFTWAVPATIPLDSCPPCGGIRLAQNSSPCVITEKAILGQWLAVSYQPSALSL
jgi:hypothetical protein